MNRSVRLILRDICIFLFSAFIFCGKVDGVTPVKPLELKIMSFNIQYGNDYWGESNLRTVLTIIEEEKPHLIAFQAVDSVEVNGRVRHRLKQLALQTGMFYSYGAAEEILGGTQGVGILSRFPLSKTQKFALPDSPSATQSTPTVSPRVLLCTFLEYAMGRGLRFCCSRIEYAAGVERAIQAAYINGLLNESIQPVILGVDLGARPNEQPYFSFRKKWVDTGKGSVLSTWAEGTPGDRFDYIFVLDNARMRVKEYKVIRRFPEASDHFPIVATIELW